jgi:hypothetical protein
MPRHRVSPSASPMTGSSRASGNPRRLGSCALRKVGSMNLAENELHLSYRVSRKGQELFSSGATAFSPGITWLIFAMSQGSFDSDGVLTSTNTCRGPCDHPFGCNRLFQRNRSLCFSSFQPLQRQTPMSRLWQRPSKNSEEQQNTRLLESWLAYFYAAQRTFWQRPASRHRSPNNMRS